MAARKTPTASAVAWRKFMKMARQAREAEGDDELRRLLMVRVRSSFETWATAEEVAGVKAQ